MTTARRLFALLALGLVLSACESGTTRPKANDSVAVDVPDDISPVLLLSPEPEGRFRQNDPTIGCPAHAARGFGFRTTFDWQDVPGATLYDVTFWQRDAQFAAIRNRVTTSQYTERHCNSFVIDRNIDNWIWTVDAMARVPISSDSGTIFVDTILSSEKRVFGFEPCRLSDGRPCNAPPPPPTDTSSDTTAASRRSGESPIVRPTGDVPLTRRKRGA